ncbi:phage tail protein [Pseudomonas sp. C11]|nr:phage tail protein [Pseudomonas sp. C11]
MSQTYFAILTAVGEAKLANAAALGNPLQISRMAVGDGNGKRLLR